MGKGIGFEGFTEQPRDGETPPKSVPFTGYDEVGLAKPEKDGSGGGSTPGPTTKGPSDGDGDE